MTLKELKKTLEAIDKLFNSSVEVAGYFKSIKDDLEKVIAEKEKEEEDAKQ